MIKSSLTPPQVDLSNVDHFVAEGRRLRAQAFLSFFRSLFSKPEPKTTQAPMNSRTA